MIEFGIRPVDGVVAGFAGQGQASRNMVDRLLGVVVVLLVAENARGLSQVVIIVDVAVGAGARRHGVSAGQREPSLGVIESRGLPGAGRVAYFASLREAALHVVRVVGVLEILLMARDARSLGQAVVVVGVAVGTRARRHGVSACERESGLGMVEVRRLPRARRVAHFASLREAALHVIRVISVLEILQVARDARSLGEVVVVVEVAVDTCARRHGVGAGERESGLGVIEGRRRPGHRGVARLACLRESLLRVVRIIGVLKILQMAGDTGRLGQGVVIVDVAIGARTWRHSVGAR